MPFPKYFSSRNHYVIVSILFLGLLLGVLATLTNGRLSIAKAQDSLAGKDVVAEKPKMISAPNGNYRAVGSRKIDTIVIHYTSAINVNPKRWADPKIAMDIFKRYHVSAHYLVDRTGTIYRLVDEHNIAWHAGGSIMPSPDNRRNVNSFSIGIETIATAKSGFTDAEYRSLAYLIKGIKSRYTIRNIVGHDEIAGQRAIGMQLRKDLKEDPGPLFDWNRLNTLVQQ